MSLIESLTILVGVYLMGTLISKWTGGIIGSAFASIPFMFALYWSGIMTVEDVNASGIPAIYGITTALILVNVGSTFNPRQVIKDWKLVLVCLGTLASVALITFTVSMSLFGRDLCIGSYPVLAGGAIAMTLMSDAATAKGMLEVAAVVVLVSTVQGWFSIPLISTMVRAESKRILGMKQEGGADFEKFMAEANAAKLQAAASGAEKVKLVEKLPKSYYNNPFLHLFLCCVFSLISTKIAGVTSPMTNGIVGAALVGIIIGIIARELGLISKSPLEKANLLPLLMFALIIASRRSLASLTPARLLANIGPILGIVGFGFIGIIIAGLVLGKFTGLSKYMCVAVAVQCYSGYPTNHQITNEVIEAVTEDPEERQMLLDYILPKIVLGGVISVSIASVVIAGVFVNLL